MEAQQDQQNAPPPPSQSPNAGSRSDEPDQDQEQPQPQQSQDGSGGVYFPAILSLLVLIGSTIPLKLCQGATLSRSTLQVKDANRMQGIAVVRDGFKNLQQ